MLLSLESISLFVGGKPLLEDASLRINTGDRIGVIGRNGSGKSHLMTLLAGIDTPDAGTYTLQVGKRVLLVSQELPEDDVSPLDYIRSKDTELSALEERVDKTKDDDIAELIEQITELEDERYSKIAPMILMGLGLTKEQLETPMSELSGGYRMRIGLAMALIFQPDVLLLDEPTNHLDLESTRWLITYLQNYPASHAFVLVSHDIRLLNAVSTTTLHLRGGELTQFEGDYFAFKEFVAAEEAKAVIANKARAIDIARHKEIYHKFRGVASRAAQAKGLLKRAVALEEEMVEIIAEEPVIKLTFAEPAPMTVPMVQITKGTIGYGKKAVLREVDFSLSYGAKIGLLGRNGEGKSTLVKLLAGKLEPLKGDITRASRLKIGYFSQDLMDELDGSLSVYEQFKAKTGISKDETIRSSLGQYGFSHDKVAVKVEDLSGGEKARLLFALICVSEPNLIIFDEPTNHLDVETREELARAIIEFKGSVVLISHDWDLHARTMNQFWLVQEGSVRTFTKGLAEYERQLALFIEANLKGHTSDGSKKAASGSVVAPKPAEKGKGIAGAGILGDMGMFAAAGTLGDMGIFAAADKRKKGAHELASAPGSGYGKRA